jgi:hypothetical protein
MGWVRYHKRFGAYLAFAALTLQIVLAFGHVHFDRVERAALTVAAAAHGGSIVVEASRQAPAQLPSDDDDDYCAICASIYLASTSLVALPPQLPVPPAFTRVAQFYIDSFGVSAPRHAAFRSRAPPAA